ncbi:hypothetical protein DXG01_007770 [Tephrocybe rancida]|nr:hypothetical protein DXG01_007770 [Tephrocybe rancida]
MFSHEIPQGERAYFNRRLAPGIIQHQFHRVPSWEAQCDPTTLEYTVLSTMKDRGIFSLIAFERAATSVIGPKEGVAHPVDIIGDQGGPAVFVTGAYFLHLPYYFKPHGGVPLHDQFLYWTVGETSLTPNFLPFDTPYQDVMKKRIMSDGSFYSTGPSLNKELDLSRPDFSRLNTSKGRYQYLAYDDLGNTIRNPMWEDRQTFDRMYQEVQLAQTHGKQMGPGLAIEAKALHQAGRTPRLQPGRNIIFSAAAPAHPLIRTSWAFVPANLSHASQPNERSGISRHPTGELLSHAYTCIRADGLTLNEFRTLVKAGSEYLGLSFEDIMEDEVWANDGGGSIFQIFVDADGNKELLVSGGQATQMHPLPLTTMREVPHAVKIGVYNDDRPATAYALTKLTT